MQVVSELWRGSNPDYPGRLETKARAETGQFSGHSPRVEISVTEAGADEIATVTGYVPATSIETARKMLDLLFKKIE